MVLGITEAQIGTAKEIFPSLFIQFGGRIPESEIAQSIFENNFDSAIVTKSLERKVVRIILCSLCSLPSRSSVRKSKRLEKKRTPFRTSFVRRVVRVRYRGGSVF